jgi:serine/threonine-protein kinase
LVRYKVQTRQLGFFGSRVSEWGGLMAESTTMTSGGIDVQNRFGALAIELGFCTQQQLHEAMKVQSAAAKAGFRKRLGDILVKKGYLTPEQLKRILSSQKVDEGKKRIANFEIVSKLGEGSMGSVFKARQRGMDRVVALKLLSPQLAKDEDFRRRFIKEARAVAKLNHPHIVSGIDVGEYNRVYYFAMEFVDGQTLAQRMESCGGRLSEKEALESARQTALALQHAHQNGLLHRDVKPENILVDKAGVTKLADLGLVRINHPGEDFSAEKGLAIGTPFYISPEQAQGLLDITPATDIYSLGATLYHILTGEPPYDAPTGREIMKKHVREPVPDPRTANPTLSPRTSRICMKCMQKDPKERYRDCEALANDIEKAIVELAAPPRVNPTTKNITPTAAKIVAAPVSTGSRTHQPRRRLTSRRGAGDASGAIIAAVAVIVVLVIAYVMMKSPQYTPPPPPPPRNTMVKPAPAPTKPAVVPKVATPKETGEPAVPKPKRRPPPTPPPALPNTETTPATEPAAPATEQVPATQEQTPETTTAQPDQPAEQPKTPEKETPPDGKEKPMELP